MQENSSAVNHICVYMNTKLSFIKPNSRKKFGTLFWSVSLEVMHL